MKRVVIVGGGFAGSLLAKELESKFDVVMIDNKDYFEFTPGILRTIAHPTRSRCMQVKHSDYLSRGRLVKGNVKDITPEHVSVKGKKLKYDYLVVATGSQYRAPFKHPHLHVASRSYELALQNKKLLEAKNVLIMGGGLVGVELAAEIAYYFPDKKVTVVNSADTLLSRMDMKARIVAREFLAARNVEIIDNERVEKHDGKMFVTTSGKRIPADIAFACIGIIPNSSPLSKHFKNKLSKAGFASVDQHLRLEGCNNIFIAGDLADIGEEKTAQNAEKHALLIAKNILRTENGLKLATYQKKSRPIVLSLGPYNGIFVKGSFVISGILPAFLKWLVEKKELMKKRA